MCADVSAFLLNNGATYWYSHAVGLAEYFASSYFWPTKYDSTYTSFPFLLVGASVPQTSDRVTAHSHSHRAVVGGTGTTFARDDPRLGVVLARGQGCKARRSHSHHPWCLLVSLCIIIRSDRAVTDA